MFNNEKYNRLFGISNQNNNYNIMNCQYIMFLAFNNIINL